MSRKSKRKTNLMKLNWKINGIILMLMIIILPIVGFIEGGQNFINFMVLGIFAFLIGYFVYEYAKKH